MKIIGMGMMALIGLVILTLAAAGPASAHCDTMAGPVVQEAIEALKEGKATPVLKWVRSKDEAEVEKAFRAAFEGRKAGSVIKAKTEKVFFETLVRLHRASEGEPFTGLKPANTPLEPGIRESDEAIQKGSAEKLMVDLSRKMSRKVNDKFRRVLETKKQSGESVAKGREYVAAYVDFVHTVEHLTLLLEEGEKEHALNNSVQDHE